MATFCYVYGVERKMMPKLVHRFSLVEMMVASAIMVILAAIGISQFQQLVPAAASRINKGCADLAVIAANPRYRCITMTVFPG